MSNAINEIDNTDLVFVFGYNPADSHPIVANHVINAKRNGAKIIVCDPRKIETARIADMHIALKNGSNIALLKWMVANGYQDRNALLRRIKKMEAWLKNPQIQEPDANAEYAAVIEINLTEITEPLLACPNDPDDIKPLSAVAGTKVDEGFIGSCQTNIGHFRAAAHLLKGKELPTRLWVVPPTKMDADTLNREGYYATLGEAGARMEVPGCSLCFGNQARARKGATVVSTSTRNFPNRMGEATNVFLGSAEVTAIASLLGRLPTKEEYMERMQVVMQKSSDIYRYMNFHRMPEYSA